jgi:ABC-type multidrug transport system fused ATPase/permease subunit
VQFDLLNLTIMRENTFMSFVPFKSLGKYVAILGKSARRKFWTVVITQSVLGFLDLVGVAIIGVLGSLALRGVQSQNAGGRTSQALEFLRIENFEFQKQIVILSLLATFFFILKTILTVVLNRKILFFLSLQAASLSDKLLARVLNKPILGIQQNSSQEIQYAVGSGVSAIALGIVGTLATVITDSSTLLILIVGLFVIDPLVAASSVLLFGLIGILLYSLTHKKAHRLGVELAELNVKSQINIQELITSYREIFVRDRREYYLWRISNLRRRHANTLAEQNFMPNISKYVLEVSVIIGAVLMSALEFAIHDAAHAAASLAIFIVAGSRIAPALMRLQQSFVQVRANEGIAASTYKLISDTNVLEPLNPRNFEPSFTYDGFEANISLTAVNFEYPGSTNKIFSDLNLTIAAGKFIAIAGHSGSGKSSLVDLLLGLHDPDSGTALISGLRTSEVIKKWPGVIGYVPQVIGLVDGSIRENLSLGFEASTFTDNQYWEALDQAQLKTFVEELSGQLDFEVGEGGSRLSGGQRQRLGIARALLTKPKLLILDEATSALDSQTELEISQSIHKLRGEVTTIMIAHRLSTIKLADMVVYLEDGGIRATGTFEEVRTKVPDFETQAELQGL